MTLVYEGIVWSELGPVAFTFPASGHVAIRVREPNYGILSFALESFTT